MMIRCNTFLQIMEKGDILNNQSISSFPLRRKISRQKVRRWTGCSESSYRPTAAKKLCPDGSLCGLHLSLRPAPLAESKSPPRAARREAFAERLFLRHNRKLRQCKPLQGEFAKANSLKNVLAGARFFAALGGSLMRRCGSKPRRGPSGQSD